MRRDLGRYHLSKKYDLAENQTVIRSRNGREAIPPHERRLLAAEATRSLTELVGGDTGRRHFPNAGRALRAGDEKVLCQQERGADALVLVFAVEDGEEDAIH